MPSHVHEPPRDVPVHAEVDVLVAGAGMAGFAAALSAARAGARTLLVERNGCLGGVATATMMANIGNRYMIADGSQVVRGIATEVVDRLVDAGGASPAWRAHKAIPMDSELLKVVIAGMLDEAGVRVLTHSVAASPITDGRCVTGCFFESKSGRRAVLAPNTVDCTGEADIAYRAGAEVTEHRFSSSLLFKLSHVDIDRFVEFLGEDPEGFPSGVDWVRDYDECASTWRDHGVFFFPHHGGKKWRWLQDLIARGVYGELRTDRHGTRPWWGPAENIDAFGMYTARRDGTLVVNTGYYCMDTIDVEQISRAELHAQRLCYFAADFMAKHIPGFERARVEHIGVDLGLRGGRFIRGRSTLRSADMVGSERDTHRDDVIATTPVKPVDQGGRPGDLGTTCDVPFGSCVPVGLAGVLVGSGKSVDAEGGNNRILRGMSGCMIYGQAAGAAAAIASKRGMPAADLPVREIQRELLRQDVRLGDERRLQELGLR